VVVGSVLLLRPGKLNQSNQPSASQPIASNAAPPSAAGAPTLVSPPQATSSADNHPGVSASSNGANLVANLVSNSVTVAPPSKDATARKFTGRQPLAPVQAENAMLLARNKKSLQQPGMLANMPASGAPAPDDSLNGETANRSATETVEVSAATGDLSPSSADSASIADSNAPAIEKAKPAVPAPAQAAELTVGAARQNETSAAPVARLQARASSAAKLAATDFAQRDVAKDNFAWTISSGLLRRSQDSGQTWQDNLHADHPLLCYATHGDEIWTGGQSGALYHSTDGGATWLQLHPSSNGRLITSDISRIDLRSLNLVSNGSGSNSGSGSGNNVSQLPGKIVLSTSNNETWTSLDGGKTWELK
jgi:hypothetical protein